MYFSKTSILWKRLTSFYQIESHSTSLNVNVNFWKWQKSSFFPPFPNPECPHAYDWSSDDGLHSGDDQHRESGGFRQALLHLQLLTGAALRPRGRHGLLDQQGSAHCVYSICWPLWKDPHVPRWFNRKENSFPDSNSIFFSSAALTMLIRAQKHQYLVTYTKSKIRKQICLCWCSGTLARATKIFFLFQVNMKMREITEREHKVKHHPLESPSHQKVKLLYCLSHWVFLLWGPIINLC